MKFFCFKLVTIILETIIVTFWGLNIFMKDYTFIFLLISVCKDGWIMISKRCIKMIRPRSKLKRDTYPSETKFTLVYSEALSSCHKHGGTLIDIDSENINILRKFLSLWNHGENMGNIWTSHNYTTGQCMMIQVYHKIFISQGIT